MEKNNSNFLFILFHDAIILCPERTKYFLARGANPGKRLPRIRALKGRNKFTFPAWTNTLGPSSLMRANILYSSCPFRAIYLIPGYHPMEKNNSNFLFILFHDAIVLCPERTKYFSPGCQPRENDCPVSAP
jgi:hypothetical protein